MIKVALVQAELTWENPEANLTHFEHLLSSVDDVDLIVLPEMFTSGFTMNAEKVAQTPNDKAVQWLQQKAKEKKAFLTTSLAIKENEKFYNRLFWVDPNGNLTTYNKRHLFRMADEHLTYSMGNERVITQINDFRFCPLVCYDLRFPVWSRNFENGVAPVYDCLIFVANWPAARSDAWISLLKARAIENQCYVIGVNRVGKDGKQISYDGNSAVFDPKGKKIDTTPIGVEAVSYAELNLKSLNDFRTKFPVHLDADKFQI